VLTTALVVKLTVTDPPPLSTLNPMSQEAATVAAFLDHPEELDQLASPARTESPELPVFQEPPANHQLPHASPLRHHHANLAHKVPLVHLDHPEELATPDHLEMPESPELMHHPVSLDPRDLPAHPERPAHLDHPEMLEPPQPASQPPLESPESPEMLDHPDQLDHPESLARTERPDQLDPRAHPDPMDHPAPMDSPDLPAHLDHLELRARRVSAPSTAPSTAACSSKTEHGDKSISTLQAKPILADKSMLLTIAKFLLIFSSTLCWQLPFRRDSVIVKRS